MLRAYLFALSLYSAYEVPIPYGVEVWEQAHEHGVNPFDMGAILMAENKSRAYDPATVGKHNGGGELGLYQIQPYPWSKKVCEIKPEELKDAKANIRCAALVIRYMQTSAGVDVEHTFWREGIEGFDREMVWRGVSRKTRDGLEWQTRYRCAPKARTSVNCGYSVKRVQKMYKLLVDAYFAQRTVAFWLHLLAASPHMIMVSQRAHEASTDVSLIDLKED